MKSLTECIKEFQISEMASKLSMFVDSLKNIHRQIVENWCLVKWCDDNSDELTSKQLRNHWATELRGHMISIAEKSLKSGRKDKVIKSIFISELELDDNTKISKIIRKKFNDEGLSKFVNKMSFECSEHIDEICKVLAGTEEDVEEYVRGEIG